MWKCDALQWQLRLVLSESVDQHSGMNIARWGHVLIILMLTEKPWVPACSHSYFSNETANQNRSSVQKCWTQCPGAGKSLSLWMCMGCHHTLLGAAGASLLINRNTVGLGRQPEDRMPFGSRRLGWFYIDLCSCWWWKAGICSHIIYTLVCMTTVSARWKRYCKPRRHVLLRLFTYK